jgi:hypothetical protein
MQMLYYYLGATCATIRGFSYMPLTKHGFIFKKNSVMIFGSRKNWVVTLDRSGAHRRLPTGTGRGSDASHRHYGRGPMTLRKGRGTH